jgi:signal peptidase I
MFKKKAVVSGAPQVAGDTKTDWKAELRSFALIILGIMGFKSVVYSNHDIPSESMLPGLYVGDYLGVSRFAYGFSRYSVPLVPLPDSLKGRIFFTQPKRGDVVVFRYPGDDSLIYIKRLIGLPGDTIEMKNGQLFLNNAAVPKVQQGTLNNKIQPNYTCEAGGKMMQYKVPKTTGGDDCVVPLYRETLPGGKSYLVFDLETDGQADNMGPFIVPPKHYFMMGDNRDNSADSRFPVIPGFIGASGVGMLDEDNLVGRAEFVYLSTNGTAKIWELWKWPQGVRWSHMFKSIK